MSDKSIETINDRYYTGERPLFNKSNLQINNTIFGEGESPLKESDNIELKNSSFQWKYPLWYAKDIGIIELVYIVLQSVVKPGITGFFKIDLHIKCYIYLS